MLKIMFKNSNVSVCFSPQNLTFGILYHTMDRTVGRDTIDKLTEMEIRIGTVGSYVQKPLPAKDLRVCISIAFRLLSEKCS